MRSRVDFARRAGKSPPRPGLRREAVQHDERAMQRLTVKPGCGGARQAGDSSDATFDEMVGMDLHTARVLHSINYPVDC